MADLADRADRVVQRHVLRHHPGLDHPQHEVGGPDLEQHRGLAHVGVTDDHVQAAEPFGVSVRLVPGIDDRPRPGGGRRHAFPDVLGALADAVHRAARRLQHLPGAADHLTGDQERRQDVSQPSQFLLPGDQVVLMAAVGVPGGVGVVLEQVDVPGNPFLAQPGLGVDQQSLEYPLACLVVRDEVDEVVALRGRVLGMAAHVEVEAGAVAEEDVAASPPGHHGPEQVARHLVGRQPPLSAKGARETVFSLHPEYAPVHLLKVRASPTGVIRGDAFPARRPLAPRPPPAFTPPSSRWPAAAPPGEEDEPGPHDYEGAPSGGQRRTGPRPRAATRRRRARWCTRGCTRGGWCSGPGRDPGGRAGNGRRASGTRRIGKGRRANLCGCCRAGGRSGGGRERANFPVRLLSPIGLTCDRRAVSSHPGHAQVSVRAELARVVAGSAAFGSREA